MTKKIKRKIIASVDDGAWGDLELGNLLLKYKIPTVFYIAPEWSDLDAITIRKIAKGGLCPQDKDCSGLFEIGAHTLTHPEDLKQLNDEELLREIAGSKTALEEIISKPITKFCYPSGRFDERVKEKVRLVGFKEARTTRVMNTDFPRDLFETDTSIHIYPERKEYQDRTWVEVGQELFEKVIRGGGRFEVWMHSIDIERYNMGEFVEDFFAWMDDEMTKIGYPRRADIPYFES